MRLTLRLLCFLLAGCAAFAAPFGFSVQTDGDQNLYRIDLATGVATPLGLITPFPDAEGLAFVGNQLYAIGGTTNELWNLTAAPGTLVGPTGARDGFDAGLAYNPVTGLLYNLNAGITFALDGFSSLYTIDPTNGLATFVGSSGVFADGLAINAAGEAFAVDAVLTMSLYSVNLMTGQLTWVGGLGLDEFIENAGLDFDSAGILWALFSDGSIYTIDTVTGAASFQHFVTNLQGERLFGFEGLAIAGNPAEVPEPATAGLFAAGLLGVALLRRRLQRLRK
jgi:hypothetical protein